MINRINCLSLPGEALDAPRAEPALAVEVLESDICTSMRSCHSQNQTTRIMHRRCA